MICGRFLWIGTALLGWVLGSAVLAAPQHSKGSHAMRPEDSRPPLFTLPDSTGHPVALHSFLGSHRIVLIFAPTSEGAEGAQYLQHVAEQQERFQERDLVVLAIVPSSHSMLEHSYEKPIILLHDPEGQISATYGATDQITFYLIGKDGGIKMARHGYPTNRELFGVIDAMPMRRQEMQTQGR